MIARPSKNDVADPTLLLSNNPLFRGCSHEDISHLLVSGVTKRYAADEYVFVKGEAGFSCYLVIDGAVGIGSYSPDGRYCPMRELMPGIFLARWRYLTTSLAAPTLWPSFLRNS